MASALVIAVRAIPQAARVSPSEAMERKAIKGLRPFNREDAEVFTQLQRERSLQECIESITTATFRFGILMGESGCGKTSFLQAGVWPQLTHETTTHWGVYVRFSERDPIQTIAKALSEQLQAPIEDILSQPKNRGDLTAVLTRAVAATDKPLVLLLDQFEQFFVHAPRAADQEPFVQALASWYRSPDPLPVKILVSIRSDLLYQLSRLHQALGYALGPQEVFVLEKFTPTEAAKILAVIAKSEQLAFESKFVEELAEEALANREEGLISPVDLQILAWMIERQREDELRAFSRVAFQKFGGVEGLLTRFLERTLSARVVPGQRQAVMKALLALTDLDRQVRAGVMTLPEIQAKLQATAKPGEVAEAVAWLVRGDVRLITPQERDGETGYELAHERLIPALIRQAGKELSAADKANQLLDRRVNEWLGNDCDRRWLLTIQELYLIGRQRPYLVWGAKHRQKQRLLRLSRQRLYRTVLALAIIAGVFSGAGSWLSFTTQGQIMQVEWQLANSVPKAHASIMADAAVALRAIATAYGELNQPTLAAEILQDALNAAQTIPDDNSKLSALSSIAFAYGELNQPTLAAEILQAALKVAQTIPANYYKSEALSSIAAATGELNQPTLAAEILQAALNTVQTIQDDNYKSLALSNIATAYGKLNQLTRAAEILQAAFQAAQTIQNDYYKSLALSDIATAYGKLNQPTRAAEILQVALQAAQTLQDDNSKSQALRNIAAATGELNQPTLAAEILQAALQAAQTLQNDNSKSQALSNIAYTIGAANEALKNEINPSNLPSNLLEKTFQILRRENASSVLRNVALLYAQQEQWGKALHVLQNCGENDRRIALILIMTLIAEKKTPALIEGAVVLKAEVNPSQPDYTLEVTIQSPDLHCRQYTNWWEIITPEGELKGRETFDQPHKDQSSWPGVLTLSAAKVKPDQPLLIRAHFKGGQMNHEGQFELSWHWSGYTNQALKGSIQAGFHRQVRLPGNFALWLEDDPPQPTECKL